MRITDYQLFFTANNYNLANDRDYRVVAYEFANKKVVNFLCHSYVHVRVICFKCNIINAYYLRCLLKLISKY